MTPIPNISPDVRTADKRKLARQEYFNQPDGFPFDSFCLDEVNLPPGEEAAAIGDDHADEEAEQHVAASLESGFAATIGEALSNYMFARYQMEEYGTVLLIHRSACTRSAKTCG